MSAAPTAGTQERAPRQGNGDEPLLLTVEQVAALVQLPRSTLYRLVAAGQFPPPVKLGRATRWHRPTLERWLDQQARRCR